MNKPDFIQELSEKLSFLPEEELRERIGFYNEMIADRMEEGLSREEAVASLGSVEEITAQIIGDTPFSTIAKGRLKKKHRLTGWEILLLALGAPIWLSLGIAAAALILAVYISVWSVVISLWAVFVSLAACAAAGIVACPVFLMGSHIYPGLAILGAGLICAGLSLLAFPVCKQAARGLVILTKKFALWIKKRFAGKEQVL